MSFLKGLDLSDQSSAIIAPHLKRKETMKLKIQVSNLPTPKQEMQGPKHN